MRSPFCSQCDNMLYIKISEEDTNQIEYFCRFCSHTEKPANQNMVLTVMSTAIENKDFNFSHIVNEYTKYDPTLPRITTMTCPNTECKSATHAKEGSTKNPDVIYIRYDDSNLKYLYLCTECDYVWTR